MGNKESETKSLPDQLKRYAERIHLQYEDIEYISALIIKAIYFVPSTVDANANDLALRIFDYCVSVEWGQGKAQMTQHDIKQLIEEWAKELAPKRELEAAVELHDRAGNLMIDALGSEKKAEVGWLFENMAEDIKRIITERDKYRQALLDIDCQVVDNHEDLRDEIQAVLDGVLKEYYESPASGRPILPPYEG